jgi:hypothetical protein
MSKTFGYHFQRYFLFPSCDNDERRKSGFGGIFNQLLKDAELPLPATNEVISTSNL